MLSAYTLHFEQNQAVSKALAQAGFALCASRHVTTLTLTNKDGEPLTIVVDNSADIQAVQAALWQIGYATTELFLAEQLNYARHCGDPAPAQEL